MNPIHPYFVRENSESTAWIGSLPPEIICKIIDCLTVRALLNFSQVSKYVSLFVARPFMRQSYQWGFEGYLTSEAIQYVKSLFELVLLNDKVFRQKKIHAEEVLEELQKRDNIYLFTLFSSSLIPYFEGNKPLTDCICKMNMQILPLDQNQKKVSAVAMNMAVRYNHEGAIDLFLRHGVTEVDTSELINLAGRFLGMEPFYKVKREGDNFFSEIQFHIILGRAKEIEKSFRILAMLVQKVWSRKNRNCLNTYNGIGGYLTRSVESERVAKLLLDAGANSNVKDRFGYRPLHYVTYRGVGNVLRLFINAGARLNAQNNDGMTPLVYACSAIKIYATEALKKENLSRVLGCVDILLVKGADPNLVDSEGRSCLHYAVLNGYFDIVERLLKHYPIDVNLQDHEGNTSLHLGCQAKENQAAIVEILLKKGADRKIENYQEKLPMDYAVLHGLTSVISLLHCTC